MTRKDYEHAVRVIARRYDAGAVRASIDEAVETLVELFNNDNPRFDENRFRIAIDKAIFAVQRKAG